MGSGLNGGKDPNAAYRKYVKAGLVSPTDASVNRLKDWVYGSEDFLLKAVLPQNVAEVVKTFRPRRFYRTKLLTSSTTTKSPQARVKRGDNLCRVMQLAANEDAEKFEWQTRRSSVITVDDVIENTAKKYGVSPAEYSGFRSGAGGGDVAAYLCRRFTSATLAGLSERFGLGHPDSSSDMVKWATELIESNSVVRKRAKRIEKTLLSKPETRV
ncbi:hypothetical protein [Neorhodopirellula pilleata]|uniref:Chromosomal replication initiator protein DnaA n=1 Tax=Neorhodopirellula pilleata TaxID=2714738 RepID=A0A5C6AW74_9BACT|nr:hypothetical protein [Neorhodopirellula pilleata]TWU03711.1 hypothetical protein Pla100_06410 [Neorhodopirellula pilleata]